MIDDEGLWNFDARFEYSSFPAEYLSGPCSWQAAVDWLAAQQTEDDEVSYRDRLFLVRSVDDGIEWARRPEVFAGLPTDQRTGQWHLVRADFPADAVVHVRGGPWGAAETCTASGVCPNCAVEVLAVGDWASVRNDLETHAPGVHPEQPPDVRVPGAWR